MSCCGAASSGGPSRRRRCRRARSWPPWRSPTRTATTTSWSTRTPNGPSARSRASSNRSEGSAMPLEAASVPDGLRGQRMAVLVAGGIAAYKVADLVSLLVQAECQVRAAMTAAATRFVGPTTFHGLSGRTVLTDLWAPDGPPEPHVELGDWAQVVLVAPATANTLAKLAAGRADDVVSATVLAARCPVVVAPAMNDAMWAKPTVRENVD